MQSTVLGLGLAFRFCYCGGTCVLVGGSLVDAGSLALTAM